MVLFLIFCITIFNLYFKHQFYNHTHRNIVNLDKIPFVINPFDKLFCPINGFKCPDEKCDCSLHCKGNYEKIHIYDHEEVVLFHEKLKTGTYCLPTGAIKCHLKSSMPVYSANNWICVSRNKNIWKDNHFIACKSPFATNNDLNILFDYKTSKKASVTVSDYYEMHNGKLRYGCKCNSKDNRGNKMVALDQVPFTCVPDYCLSNFTNNTQDIGWDGTQCKCDPFSHEIPNDKTSPCINVRVGVHNNEYKSFVKCTNRFTPKREPIYCNEPYLEFSKTITFGNFPMDFLKKTL